MPDKIKQIEKKLDFIEEMKLSLANFDDVDFHYLTYESFLEEELEKYDSELFDEDKELISERAADQSDEYMAYLEDVISSLNSTLTDISRGNLRNISVDMEIISRKVSGVDDILEDIESFGIDYNQLSKTINYILKVINIEDYFESSQGFSLQPVLEDLTNELIIYLTNNPELMYSMEPRLFEKLILEIFKKFRMDVQLTKQTRDGGYDIIAFDDKYYTKNSYIIECKRYNPIRKKVGVDIVQRLYGVKMAMGINKAFLVTSSFFTKDALNFAKQHIWDIDLKDHNDIITWLNKFWP